MKRFMKSCQIVVVACLLLVCVPAAATAAPGLLVPAYFAADCTESSLGGPWAALVRGGSNVIAIINPASGPDYSKKDLTILCTPHLAAAGIRTIGYVATGYSKRNLANVTKDIDTYFDQFGADLAGIFLDEGSSWFEAGARVINYYSAVTTHIRLKFGESPVIVINSGTRFPQQFLGQADIVVGYESNTSVWTEGNFHGICAPAAFIKAAGDADYCKSSGLNDTQLYCDKWGAFCRSPQQTTVAALVLCAKAATWQSYATQAVQAGYQWIYVTDYGCDDGNPFESLPTWWDKLLTFIKP